MASIASMSLFDFSVLYICPSVGVITAVSQDFANSSAVSFPTTPSFLPSSRIVLIASASSGAIVSFLSIRYITLSLDFTICLPLESTVTFIGFPCSSTTSILYAE